MLDFKEKISEEISKITKIDKNELFEYYDMTLPKQNRKIHPIHCQFATVRFQFPLPFLKNHMKALKVL